MDCRKMYGNLTAKLKMGNIVSWFNITEDDFQEDISENAPKLATYGLNHLHKSSRQVK